MSKTAREYEEMRIAKDLLEEELRTLLSDFQASFGMVIERVELQGMAVPGLTHNIDRVAVTAYSQ